MNKDGTDRKRNGRKRIESMKKGKERIKAEGMRKKGRHQDGMGRE